MKCCIVPNAMLGFVGVTARETSVAGVTVSVVAPVTFPRTALIVVDPEDAEVAKPLEPDVLLMVAAAAVEELQVTDVVKS
jgi:hypothetical protein